MGSVRNEIQSDSPAEVKVADCQRHGRVSTKVICSALYHWTHLILPAFAAAVEALERNGLLHRAEELGPCIGT